MKTKLRIIILGLILILLFPACKKNIFDEMGLMEDGTEEIEEEEMEEEEMEEEEMEEEEMEEEEMEEVTETTQDPPRVIIQASHITENTVISQDRIIGYPTFDSSYPDYFKISH